MTPTTEARSSRRPPRSCTGPAGGALLAVLAIAVAACAEGSRTLSPAELALLGELRLDDPTVSAALAREGGPVERLTVAGPDGEPTEANAVAVPVTRGPSGEMIARLRDAAGPVRYGLYLAERNFGFEPDRVALLPDADPYAYLDLVGVDGSGRGVDHRAVVAALRSWDERSGLDLVGAGADWVMFRLERPPEWDALAAEVHAFCPDVVEQGTETVEVLARELSRSRTVYCWWE